MRIRFDFGTLTLVAELLNTPTAKAVAAALPITSQDEAGVVRFADTHLSVTKEETKGRTVARADLLLGDARVNEVSRMLAGVEQSAHARRHARELLQHSMGGAR